MNETARMDMAANRVARKYSRKELAVRLLWALARPFFALSPRLLWGWRAWILRRFGARIGTGVHLFPSVRITIPWTLEIEDDVTVGDGVILYALGPMRLGARVTISQGAHLCGGTHDFQHPAFPLIRSPITIEEDVWIAADAFVGPDVTVGPRAVVAARAVVVSDVAADAIVAGNPARVIGQRRIQAT